MGSGKEQRAYALTIYLNFKTNYLEDGTELSETKISGITFDKNLCIFKWINEFSCEKFSIYFPFRFDKHRDTKSRTLVQCAHSLHVYIDIFQDSIEMRVAKYILNPMSVW